MPKIRIVRGSYTTTSGEKAEPGDEIEVSDDVVERLNNPSYELVEEQDEDPTPEPTTSEDIGNDVEESEDTDHPEVETPEPVTSGEDEDQDEDAESESEDEEIDAPEGADSEDIGDQTPTPDVPDDYTLLSKMAAEYDGDEINGAMSGDQITQFLESLSPTEVNGLKRKAVQDMED